MKRRLLVIVMIVTFGILAFALTAKKLAAQRSLPPTSIAFMRYYSDPGDFDLFVLNPELPEQESPALAAHIQPDMPPLWKPQGGVILYTATQDNNQDIFAVRLDGKKLTNLTKHPATDTTPVWSPNGKFIAFASDRDKEPGLTEIYVMDANGSHVIRITRSGATGFATQPAWSPDGNTIVYLYHASKDADPSLTFTNPTGSRETPFGEPLKYHSAPAWSPDGNIVAITNDVENDCELQIISADHSFQYVIARFPRRTKTGNRLFKSSTCQFNWSPDSHSIVYSAPDGDTNKIFLVATSGEIRHLTSGFADDQMPYFSPDGKQVVFSSNLLGTYNLYRVKVDGSDQVPFMALGYDSISPVWGWTGPIEF